MAWVLPEIVVQKVLAHGIKQLRSDKVAFYDIFAQFTQDELNNDYGSKYLDEIWSWFSTTKIPVIKAWSFNANVIPCISVHLANETEDESKAAFSDIAMDTEDEQLNTGVFTAMVDIGIHANKAGDHVLWMYYISSYILFRHKAMAERLGLKLHTFSASDYQKDSNKMTENIWTRWIRFRCTTQNFWAPSTGTPAEIDDVNTDFMIGLPPASDISTSNDVDPSEVDDTVNNGVIASRQFDPDGEDDVNI